MVQPDCGRLPQVTLGPWQAVQVPGGAWTIRANDGPATEERAERMHGALKRRWKRRSKVRIVEEWEKARVEGWDMVGYVARLVGRYVVTCIIMQKNGAPLHTAATCYWDVKTDGLCCMQVQALRGTTRVHRRRLSGVLCRVRSSRLSS